MRRLIYILLFSFFSQGLLFGQFYTTGQDPANIHWQQIKTEYFRLVYPDYAQKQAQHFANRLLWAAQQVPKGLNYQPKRINILMHMEAATSNAMVIWAPKRMETYNTPPQSGYGEDWWEQLALHEFRHVVQVGKMRQGFTKVLSFVFGEAATGGILGAYIPLWFLEGDAVATETALSKTGRGRDPSFSMDLKAQILEKKIYSYDKAYNGSYKNYVPNHYVLGYHLSTFGQQKYGADFWSNTLDYAARNPYMIVPFSHSIKKQSGLNKTHFYSEVLSELDSIWQLNQAQIRYSSFDTLLHNTQADFKSFLYPNQLDKRHIICLMTGIDDIPRIVKVDIKKHWIKRLHTPGYGSIDNISVAGNLVIWNERGYNPRWQHRKFMIVKSYNLTTGKVKQLTHRTRYYYPNLDVEGKRIVVVEVSKDNKYALVILDASTGDILKSIPSKNFIKNPSFSSDSKEIVALEINKYGNSIVGFNIKTTHKRTIFGPTFENISTPLQSNQNIIFISTKSGISNAHSYDTIQNKEYQITSVPFGLSNLGLGINQQIIFNSYSASGDLIATQEILNNQIAIQGKKDDFYKSYLSKEKSNIQLNPPIDSVFNSSKYHKFPHLFNIHSWAPIGLNINNQDVNPGITFASQNLLSTMISTFGYEYRMNEQTSRYYANFSYMGWYPVIDFDIEYEDRAGSLKYPDGHKTRYTYNSTNVGINIKQPLNLSKGKYFNYIQPSIGVYVQMLGANASTPAQFPSGEVFHSFRYRLYAQHKLKMGKRDIETRWGQSIDFNYRDAPLNNLSKGALFSGVLRLYFPGIMHHHTARFYMAYQQKEGDYYVSSDLILFPRGYYQIDNNKYQSFRFDYIFPIFYPDISLGSLAYFKRLKAALFFDYGSGTYINELGNSISQEHKSIGIDLSTNLHFLRHMAPFDIGIRSAYLINNQSMYYEFLFGVKL